MLKQAIDSHSSISIPLSGGAKGATGTTGATGETGDTGAMGPQGPMATVSIVATEPIPAFAAVTSTGKVANSGNTALYGKVVGIALAAIANGFSGSVAEIGEVTNPDWTWTAGEPIFIIHGRVYGSSASFVISLRVGSWRSVHYSSWRIFCHWGAYRSNRAWLDSLGRNSILRAVAD